jgi:hypothetical protein
MLGRHLAMAAVLLASAPAVQAAPAAGVAAYCAAHPNADDPGRAFYGAASKPELVPPEVANAGANTWRCMDGWVQVCAIGADGRACGKLDPGLSPTKPVRDYCAANPGSDFVPIVVIGNSATTWRCNGAVPHPLETQRLDKRGFIASRWRPLSNAAH